MISHQADISLFIKRPRSVFCKWCGHYIDRASLLRHVEARHPEKKHLGEHGNKSLIDPQNEKKIRKALNFQSNV